jgi:multiple sugar transport system ATP-binding protein
MNILPAHLESQPGAMALTLANGLRPLTLPRPGIASNPEVELGIRPEHLRLTDAADRQALIAGRIRLVERLGNQTLVHLETPASAIVVQGPGDLPARVGDSAAIAPDPARAHVFGADGVAL